MPSLLVPATYNSDPFTRRPSTVVPQFQLYAVEKWLVDRTRHVALLLVYTGDPAHTVPLDELATDDIRLYDTAVHAFRRDGAKPKPTPTGTVMATSLAHFRSDWTIVNIPNGDFDAAKDQLFANINLLRMGCSGRSALSLDEPSDTTKDRFISLYHLPETSFSPPEQLQLASPSSKRLPTVRGKTKDSRTFIHTVLELVKILQAALSIFGYYSNSPIDGLLCDTTLDAITRWMADIGEPLLSLEPTERVVDPMFISAILSLVLSVRNKLSTLIALDFSSHQSSSIIPPPPPKDPFLFPQAFSQALSQYLQASNSAPPSGATLNTQIIEAIDSAYESATRKRLKPVRKVLRSKLDDLPYNKVDSEGDEKKDARDLYHYNYRSGGEDPPSASASTNVSPTAPSSGRLLSLAALTPSSSTHLAGAGLSALNAPTNDLASFLIVALTKEKDGDKLISGPTFTGLHVRAHAQGRRDRKRRMGTSVSAISDPPTASLKGKSRESVDLGHFYAANSGDPVSPEGFANTRIIDTVVAGSVKALWSGRVAELVRLREYINAPPAALSELVPSISLRVPSGGSAFSGSSSLGKARSKSRSKASSSISISGIPTPNVHSDGDVNHPKSETDEDSEGVYNTAPNASQTMFGSKLGGKVKGKLGTWTALAKRRTARGDSGSMDLTGLLPISMKSAPSSIGVSPAASQHSAAGDAVKGGGVDAKAKPKLADVPLSPSSSKPRPLRVKTTRSGLGGRNRSGSIVGILGVGRSNSSGPQSPTLPPMLFASGEHHPGEDESEMLSSGQISPLSDYKPNPFNMLQSGGSVSISVPIGQSFASSTANLLPSSSTAVQETANKLRSKLLDVTHWQQRQSEREALGRAKRPSGGARRLTAPSTLPRITSWSDPMSARHILGPNDSDHESDTTEDEDPNLEDAIEEEEEGVGYERLEGYGLHESDDPTSVLKTARPLPKFTAGRPKLDRNGKSPQRLPTLKRKHLTSSVLGAGSDGELFSREGREKARFHSFLSVVGRDGAFIGEPARSGLVDELGLQDLSGEEGEGEKWMRRQRSLRKRGCLGLGPAVCGGLVRRRSFHDLDDFQDLSILAPERMTIDVEICGQVLVMLRREEHLRNVVACLKLLNANLSNTNAILRQDYETNLPSLSTVEARTKVLAALDVHNVNADKLAQSTNIVRYEAEQFRVPDLWHAAGLSRQKVFTLRQKVFVGRHLPNGTQGAHGRFNRLQRTIGGEEHLADYFGRTESEAEEEEALVEDLPFEENKNRLIDVDLVQRSDIAALTERFAENEEARMDDEDEVEHSSIRPMWLLRFFVGWGARWSARAATNGGAGGPLVGDTKPSEEFLSHAVEEYGPTSTLNTPRIIISSAEDDGESRKDR